MNRIGWGVVIAHGVILFSLCVHHFFVKQERKKIVVRTVHVPLAQSGSSTKVVAVTPKKVVNKTPAPPFAVKKTAAKPVQNVDQVLKELDKQLALLETPVEAKIAPLHIPNLPPVEQMESQGSANYGELLMGLLQTSLVLPDFGTVLVELEIDPVLGKLLRCTVMDSQSEKNSDFLQKQLPMVALPCFNGKSNETFVCTILFKNL